MDKGVVVQCTSPLSSLHVILFGGMFRKCNKLKRAIDNMKRLWHVHPFLQRKIQELQPTMTWSRVRNIDTSKKKKKKPLLNITDLMWYLICCSVTCSLAWSHLCSEDTDAIHPHQSSQQSFTKYIPFATLQLHPASFCLLSIPVSSFSSSPVNSQTLTPPILTSFVPVLSPTKKKTEKRNNSLAFPNKIQI